MMTIHAHCACGTLQFHSNHPPILQFVCHCRDCQQATGRPFVETIFFKKTQVDIQGNLASHRFISATGPNTNRDFCPRCNTVMFDQSEGFPGIIGVMYDCIEQPFSFEPKCHVWVSSKQDHIQIPVNITQFAENIVL